MISLKVPGFNLQIDVSNNNLFHFNGNLTPFAKSQLINDLLLEDNQGFRHVLF